MAHKARGGNWPTFGLIRTDVREMPDAPVLLVPDPSVVECPARVRNERGRVYRNHHRNASTLVRVRNYDRWMSLAGVAKETLQIVENGGYDGPRGWISLEPSLGEALSGTRLYAGVESLSVRPRSDVTRPAGGPDTWDLWGGSTVWAARRLAAEGRVALLNFASAKNPGGGFIRGARAQEEDLARCSALYDCVRRATEYYEANRRERSMLYTDHVIYSPQVPFFRDEQLALLTDPFNASVVTAPAPNAGQHLARDPDGRAAISEALQRRTDLVLRVFAENGERALVLGAWGCGVFRNDPAEVARTFVRCLEHPDLAGAFDRVVFAVLDRSRSKHVITAFDRVLNEVPNAGS